MPWPLLQRRVARWFAEAVSRADDESAETCADLAMLFARATDGPPGLRLLLDELELAEIQRIEMDEPLGTPWPQIVATARDFAAVLSDVLRPGSNDSCFEGPAAYAAA